MMGLMILGGIIVGIGFSISCCMAMSSRWSRWEEKRELGGMLNVNTKNNESNR